MISPIGPFRNQVLPPVQRQPVSELPLRTGFLRELANTSKPHATSNISNVPQLQNTIGASERMHTRDREGVIAVALATGNPFFARRRLIESSEFAANETSYSLAV